jgi:hypothetical protein
MPVSAATGNTSQVNVANRTNVNRNTNVNNNVNVNRNVNVNVNGGYGYRGPVVVQDNSWSWGSFAAGAAVGVATTAVVAAATRPATTTVTTTTVVAPAIGTAVNVLPTTGCVTVAGAPMALYTCAGAYHRPYYQGSALVYQIVRYP